MTKNKSRLLLITLLTLMVIGVYMPYFLTNTPFEYGGDLKPQWYPFFIEFKDQINLSNLLSGILPFYSWDLFLGTNYWASMSFYGLSDIFSYISLLFTTHFYTTYMIVTGFKVVLAGIFFFELSHQFSENNIAKVIVSVAYAFSAWIIYFYGQGTFISFYLYVPLFLLTVENALSKNKFIFFTLMTAVILMANYVLFFSLTLFLPIYVIYRYYLINNGFNGILKKVLTLIAHYILGVGISAVIIFPTFIYMMSNDRVGYTILNLTFDDLRVYYHLLVGMLVPSHVFIYVNNVFETNYHISREILLFSGSWVVLLLTQIFTEKDKTFKYATLIVYGLLFVLLFIPAGSSLMNGLSEYSFRWTYIIIIFNLLISLRYLSHIQDLNKKTLIFSLIVLIGLILSIIPITLQSQDQLSLINDFKPQILLFIYIVILMSIYTLLFVFKPKHTLLIVLSVFVLESFGFAFYNIGYFRRLPLDNWDQIHRATHVLEDSEQELNTYLNNLEEGNDTSYFRVYIPRESLYWNYSHNMNLIYDLKGVMTYQSTYQTSLNELKYISPSIMDFRSSWIFNIKEPQILNFVNVKYAIVTSIDELPVGNYKLIDDNFRWGFKVYKNMDYRELITTYSNIEDIQPLFDVHTIENADLNSIVYAHSEDINDIKTYLNEGSTSTLNSVYYYNNELHASLSTSTSSFAIITIPYDEGWKVIVNNQEVKTFKVNGGFIGIPVEANQNSIDMYFVPVGFKTGLITSVFSTIIIIILGLIEFKKARSI